MSDAELLKYAIENGMLDTALVKEKIEMQRRKELLEKHPYEIWEGKDGNWRTYLPDEVKGRKLVKRTTKESVEKCVIKYWGDNTEEEIQKKIAKNISLKEIFPEWLQFKQIHTNSTSYTKRITADWKKYYSKQTDFINMPIQKMDTLILDEWAHSMIKKNELTKKAYYNMSIILRQCLDYAVEKKYVEKNMFSDVKINTKLFKRVKKLSGESQVYTNDEEERFVADMIRRFQDNSQNTAPLAVILAFEIGVRIAELCALRFGDIDGNYIHIQRQEVREFEYVDGYNMKFKQFRVVEYAKSEDGYRDIYLTKTARKIIALADYMNHVNHEHTEEGYIFVKGNENINHYSIQAMIIRGCNRVNMEVKTCHKIRKTYISTLIDSGLNIDAIRRFAGHSDERTTYGNYCYNRLTDKQTEDVVENALNSQKVIKGNQIFELPMLGKAL